MSQEVSRVHKIPFRKICGLLHIRQKIVNVYPDYANKMVVVETERNARNTETVIEYKNSYLDIRKMSASEYNQMPHEPNVTDKLKALLDENERDVLLRSLQHTIHQAERQLEQVQSAKNKAATENTLQIARRAIAKLTGDLNE